MGKINSYGWLIFFVNQIQKKKISSLKLNKEIVQHCQLSIYFMIILQIRISAHLNNFLLKSWFSSKANILGFIISSGTLYNQNEYN